LAAESAKLSTPMGVDTLADAIWMNDLWAVGLAGALVGTAVGWPLLRLRAVTNDVTGGSLRMVGALLIGGAVATALIAVTHSRLPSPSMALSFEHLQKGGDLLFWSLLTLWIRYSTGAHTSRHTQIVLIAAPILTYAIFAARMDEPPGFAWLLPMGGASALYALIRWFRYGRPGSTAMADRLRTRMVLFATAICVAQTVRTLWPHVAALREVVPLTMTLGFISIAELAMHRVLNPVGDSADRAHEQSYSRSALDPGAAATLLSELDHGMREQHWYRDPELSLRSLSEKLGTTPHAISQALNQRAGRSLSEYLAGWRVAEARRLLLDRSSARFSIDGLAHSAGFGSRSAFYKTFKAAEGVTPTEFRARAKDESRA
jgi:AraC-like DNA-binding protein